MIYPQLADAAWLREQVAANRNTRDIAAIVGCAQASAAYALRTHGIQLPRQCSVCGGTFGHVDYKVHIRTCKRRVTHEQTCPYCHEVFYGNGYHEHTHHCIDNPAVHALTRQLLDNGDGVILAMHAYNARRVGTLAATHRMLLRRYTTWANVADVFGLLAGRTVQDAQECAQVEVEFELTRTERLILERESHRGLPVCSVRMVGNEQWCMLR